MERSGPAKANHGYATSFDCVENKDKLSFLGAVSGEKSLVVDDHPTLFEKPATCYAGKTASGVMGSDPSAAAKESHVANGCLCYHPFCVPQENIGGTSDLRESKTSTRCRIMAAVGSLGSGEYGRRGSNYIEEDDDRVAKGLR